MLKLGDRVSPYGELRQIVFPEHPQAGELLYFFVDRHGSVALMPATAIDELMRAK